MINSVILEERGLRMLTEAGSILIENDVSMDRYFNLKLAISDDRASHFENSRLQGTSSVYDRDGGYKHISPLEFLNNIASRSDIVIEDYAETKELREFLDGFLIKEVN